MTIKLITDSNCDLPLNYIKENRLEIIPFQYTIEGKDFTDDFGQTLPYTEFYNKLRSGQQSITSQIPPAQFEEIFSKYVRDGFEVIYIGFSSALSGSFNSACLARNSVLENYPNAKIVTIDSLLASSGQGLLVYKTINFLNEEKNFQEVIDFVEKTKHNIRTIFTVDSLDHLKRGGRLSATSAAFGYLLEIKPILEVNKVGALVPIGKVRGRKKSITALYDAITSEIGAKLETTVIINHADCVEEATDLRERLQMKIISANIILNELGPIIGSHVGPGTIAVAYMNDE